MHTICFLQRIGKPLCRLRPIVNRNNPFLRRVGLYPPPESPARAAQDRPEETDGTDVHS